MWLTVNRVCHPLIFRMVRITLFHGSPHRFNKFELSPKTAKSGSGANVYGYGMYFARKQGDTSNYKALGETKLLRDGEPIDPPIWDDRINSLAITRNKDELLNIARHHEANAKAAEKEWLMTPLMRRTHSASDDHYAKMNRLNQRAALARGYAEDIEKGVRFKRGTGHSYAVEIDDKRIEKFLNWDQPLYQQAHVRDAIEYGHPELWKRLQKLEDQIDRPIEGADVASELKMMLYDKKMDEAFKQNSRGNTASIATLKGFTDEVEIEASKILDDLGIPGIKVGGGRFSPGDDDTFVVFNMMDIDEVRRDGKLVYKRKGL